jgi:hypothetical protein
VHEKADQLAQARWKKGTSLCQVASMADP